MDELIVQLTEEDKKGRLFIGEKGEELAYMAYRKVRDKLIIIDHTEVTDALRGKGAGRKMLNFMVDLARERKAKIIPLCPYARSVFQKDESIQDVLR